MVPVLHVLVGGLDRDFKSALRFERLLIASLYLNVAMLAPRDFEDGWLELVTESVVLRCHEEDLVETLAALDGVSTHVGRIHEHLFRVVTLWVAPRLLLLPHAIFSNRQRWIRCEQAEASRPKIKAKLSLSL